MLLSGTMPFPGDRVTELHAAMLDGSFTLNTDFAPSLKELFGRLFQVKPAKVWVDLVL